MTVFKKCDKIMAFKFSLIIFNQCIIATHDHVLLNNCFLMLVYNACAKMYVIIFISEMLI